METTYVVDDTKNEKGTNALIEQNLRRLYQQTLEEELPDRFKTLLRDLKASETKAGSKA